MTEQAFTVGRFENRNGATSWRVSGLLAGIRIRRNFKTREEAAAEKAALEIRAFQACAGMRIATTFLSDSQLRDAETAFRRIADRGQSLGFYLDLALANYRAVALVSGVTSNAATQGRIKCSHLERGVMKGFRGWRTSPERRVCFPQRQSPWA